MRARTAWRGLIAGLALLTAPPSAALGADATLQATFLTEPTQNVDTSVSFTGTSDSALRLSAYVTRGSDACTDAGWPTTRLQDVIRTDAVQVGPGAFRHDVTFQPEKSASLRLCAFLYDGILPPYAATVDTTFHVRNAPATLAIAASPERVSGRPISLTVSGTASASRRVHVKAVRGADCAASGETIGPAAGTGVSPGPFSLPFLWTAYDGLGLSYTVCADVSAFHSDLGPDATASLPIELPQPPALRDDGDDDPPLPPAPSRAIVLGTPADGASGEILNPVFSWTQSGQLRRDPPAKDTLELFRVRGDDVTQLLRINPRTFRLLDERAGMEMYPSGDAETIAHVDVGERETTIRLKRGLPPGVYEWVVERRGVTSPAPRRFTVLAPRIASLAVAEKRKRGSGSYDPGWTFLYLSSQPYVRYEFSYRHGGGPWRSYRIAARRTPRQAAVIGWSCAPPGGRFAWRVLARDAHGQERRRAGSTRNVTRADCTRMRRREAAERRAAERRRVAEERRRRAEAERRRRAEERRRAAERDRFRRNCEAVGGAAVWIDGGDGYSYLICRAPWGGELPVPGF